MARYQFAAGFGKGQWKLVKTGTDKLPNQVLFNCTSDEDLVCLNGVVMTLNKCLKAQREINPECTVNYHRMKDIVDAPGRFTLEVTHRVAYTVATEKPATINLNNIGITELPDLWTSLTDDNVVFKIIWTVRWTPKGLVPCKPAVYFARALTLKAGHGCKVSG